MKKKVLALLMTLVMVFGLIACGGGDTAEPTKAPEATKTEATKAHHPHHISIAKCDRQKSQEDTHQVKETNRC